MEGKEKAGREGTGRGGRKRRGRMRKNRMQGVRKKERRESPPPIHISGYATGDRIAF